MLLVSSRLNEIVKNTEVKHVLLTGHSAGGAVASLMFTKYLSQAAVDRKPHHSEPLKKWITDKIYS